MADDVRRMTEVQKLRYQLKAMQRGVLDAVFDTAILFVPIFCVAGMITTAFKIWFWVYGISF